LKMIADSEKKKIASHPIKKKKKGRKTPHKDELRKIDREKFKDHSGKTKKPRKGDRSKQSEIQENRGNKGETSGGPCTGRGWDARWASNAN